MRLRSYFDSSKENKLVLGNLESRIAHMIAIIKWVLDYHKRYNV